MGAGRWPSLRTRRRCFTQTCFFRAGPTAGMLISICSWTWADPEPRAQPSWPLPLLQRSEVQDSRGFVVSRSRVMRARAKLLSWGFPKIASPPASASHVRCVSRMVAHPSARRCHPSRAIRPCRSSRLRRFDPCDPLQVCCALQPILRFAPFRIISAFCSPLLPAVRVQHLDLPRMRTTPFRAFPSPSAVPRHRGLCPPVVCRPQGLARPTNPLSRSGVST